MRLHVFSNQIGIQVEKRKILLILTRFGYFGLVKVALSPNTLSTTVSGQIKEGTKLFVNNLIYTGQN